MDEYLTLAYQDWCAVDSINATVNNVIDSITIEQLLVDGIGDMTLGEVYSAINKLKYDAENIVVVELDEPSRVAESEVVNIMEYDTRIGKITGDIYTKLIYSEGL